MSSSNGPLLTRQVSDSDLSHDLAEEDALLTGQKSAQHSRWKRWREIGALAWAVIATIAVVALAVALRRPANQNGAVKLEGKRNLIFMVSDGMGPTYLSLTRGFQQFSNDDLSEHLLLDEHLIGQSRTRSNSSLVTDSAAGATAFSCGHKSYNGAISVLPDHSPCGTVLEAAKKAGYMTGLVVTTRITDATPACFAAHVNKRIEEDRIAEQLIGDYPLGRVVDLMLGGGRCFFLGNSANESCRADDRNIIGEAKERGFHYIDNKGQFEALKGGKNAQLPLLGLFAPRDIPYEIDRHQEQIHPPLHEMAETAMRALSEATKDSDKGFFLMIEGSRIDHAGHANDPAALVWEVQAYDKAFRSVLKFIDEEPTQTLMVGTSDHETGGLASAKQLYEFQYPQYLWVPGQLYNTSHSASWMAKEFTRHAQMLDSSATDIEEQLREWLHKALPAHLGIHDASDAEIDKILEHVEFAQWVFADMVSRRAQVGWSTHGHSAADVNIYTSDSRHARALRGNHENTEVGRFLSDWLDVDVDAVTEELRRKGVEWEREHRHAGVSWMGKAPDQHERLDGQHHIDHYEGSFAKRDGDVVCSVCGV